VTITGALLERAREIRAERRGASLSALLALADRGGLTHAGINVNLTNALMHDAVWACVRLLAETIATLPVAAYRKTGDVRRELPSQPQIVEAPSALLDRSEFIAQVVLSIIENGNAYGQIVGRDGLGFPNQIELRDHADVRVTREGKTGPPIYRIDNKLVARADVFHVRGLTRPGQITGISTIEAAKQTIARGLAAEKYGGQWFGDGAHPSAVLEAEGAVTEAAAKAIKKRFMDAVQGREPVVLGQGLEYKAIQLEPEKSQLVEVERLIAEKAARFFLIPGEMIGVAASGSSVTYANREQREQAFAQHALLPWLVRIERPWSALLPKPEFVKFNYEGMLRADTQGRYQSYNVALRAGWLSVNEVRELEEREPIEGGDEYVSLPAGKAAGSTGGGT
jgi:HK97 family phage portal protein